MDRLRALTGAVDRARGAKALLESGILLPARPDRMIAAVGALARWGTTAAGGYAAAAARYPSAVALVDDRGSLTFAELDHRAAAIARGLRRAGVGAGDGVAILCRNHRGFVEATIAASKLGAHALYLNTGFAPPQAREVLDRERAVALVHDEEFAEIASAAGERLRFVAWHDDRVAGPTLDDLVAADDGSDITPPERPGRVVILTSGTTGTPKGAQRHATASLGTALALFERVPMRVREATVIAAPLFHAWGLAHLTIGMALASTIVLQRRFDPEATLRALAQTRATALAVVPVMLQRILDLDEQVLERYELPALRVVASSGSALPGDLALRWMDRFGDNLYNLYGSTEVAWATIATPRDLREAPGTAGRPPIGTVVKILDGEGRELPPGTTGRIFVRNEMMFEGYTGGGSKAVIGGLMSVGDVGHFDDRGRLFVEGREDDMIVSGGENVFPGEVEDLLARHPGVADVAIVGVDDAEFGQRLRACVVRRPGSDLDEEGVKHHVRDHLARYKVPREVVFLDDLPRNATGKVLRSRLR